MEKKMKVLVYSLAQARRLRQQRELIENQIMKEKQFAGRLGVSVFF